MTNINWSIAGLARDPGAAFTDAFKAGQTQRMEAEGRNALAALMANPNDPNALAAGARYDPVATLKMQELAAERAQTEAARNVGRVAAGGDMAGARRMAFETGNFDLAKTLDGLGAPDKDTIKRRSEYIGNAALRISQLPPEQRAAAWDHYAQNGARFGVEGLEAYVGQYSEEALQSAIAQAGMVKDYFETQSIDYKVIPEGGYLQGFDSMGRPLGETREAPQAAPAQADAATLRAQAAEAIANGADPAAVNARLEQMLGGAGQAGPRNFP